MLWIYNGCGAGAPRRAPPGEPGMSVHCTGPGRGANTKGAEERYATSAYAWAGTTCTRVWTFFLRVYFSYFTVPSTVANRV